VAITERDRRDLFVTLEQALGPTQAETLMRLLPHQPADELVTISYCQSEMGALRAELRGEMTELRSEVRKDLSSLEVKFTRLWAGTAAANALALVTALVT